ncbi:MAG TPA: TIGR04282 family arsenosugar biosynthesis glycosyltransferase [Acidimicrobiia bacterium]
MTTTVVMAKAPVPGRVKTRLCPPCTPEQAAALAAAALVDTLGAVQATACDRRVLALDGAPGPWLPPGWAVVPQSGGGLAARLDAAVVAIDGPVLVVGMDTPQVTPKLLDAAWARLLAPDTDAVLGPADDGGYWAIGVRAPRAGLFDDVEMSTTRTGAQQRARLRALVLSVAELDRLRDVDTFADAQAVAAHIPSSRFAHQLARTRVAA